MITRLLIACAVASVLVAAPGANAQAPSPAGAQEAARKDEFSRATVVEILDDRTEEVEGASERVQRVRLRITSGSERGTVIEIDHGGDFTVMAEQFVRRGEAVAVIKSNAFGEASYYIVDKYRLPQLGWLVAFFFGLAVAIGRLRGATSILGLGFTILVLTLFVVPRILAGDNPLLVSIIGSAVIVGVSLFLSHGWNRRTRTAAVSTIASLVLSGILAVIFVRFSRLFGMGSEEAFSLQFGQFASLDFRGLLLGGIIIGALGVLDDVTTAQTASVEEIHNANEKLGAAELYRRGISVGREHIASLVNTLALAYIGASFPLFLIFSSDTTRPLWVILNSESIAEEIVRALAGSAALILAVPISTAVAAYVFARRQSLK